MIKNRPLEFRLNSPRIKVHVREAVWDSTIYGTPVVQIDNLELIDIKGAENDFFQYQDWVEKERVGMASCRLPHNQLQKSIFLEKKNFRFIEMVLHPRIEYLQSISFPKTNLSILPAELEDLDELQNIAEFAFGYERFHVDPRLNPKLADLRYKKWVVNSFKHDSQYLLKVLDKERLIALFIIEKQSDGSMYWHLTAISPKWQGQGYGRQVWLAMLLYHQNDGYQTISTTISARNTPVLNLYSQLQFRFTPPMITLHWVRTD